MQFDDTSRNAMLDSLEVVLGTSPVLKIFSGSAPANCAAADSGTLLASLTLPSDWMAAASGGTKSKSGTWEDTSADAGSPTNAGHWRLYTSGGTCRWQGTITATGGGGDMTLDSIAITAGQGIQITGFTLTAPGA